MQTLQYRSWERDPPILARRRLRKKTNIRRDVWWWTTHLFPSWKHMWILSGTGHPVLFVCPVTHGIIRQDYLGQNEPHCVWLFDRVRKRATVRTSFITSFKPETVAETSPELTKLVNDTVEKLKQEKTRKLSKYDYPDHIVTAAMMQKMAHYGVHFRVRREECQLVRSLDAQRSMKKGDLRGRASAVRPGGSQEAERRKAGSRKCQKAGRGCHLLWTFRTWEGTGGSIK